MYGSTEPRKVEYYVPLLFSEKGGQQDLFYYLTTPVLLLANLRRASTTNFHLLSTVRELVNRQLSIDRNGHDFHVLLQNMFYMWVQNCTLIELFLNKILNVKHG